MATQKETILNSNAPLHKVGNTTYKGKSPVYINAAGPNEPARFEKIQRGIPFVRVNTDKGSA